MNLAEILEELNKFCTWAKESLDKDAEEWGQLKARKEHEKELKEIKFSEIKMRFRQETDAKQKTLARVTEEWKEFMAQQVVQTAEYHTSDYKKGFKEKLIEVLRSLLSFNKDRIRQEI